MPWDKARLDLSRRSASVEEGGTILGKVSLGTLGDQVKAHSRPAPDRDHAVIHNGALLHGLDNKTVSLQISLPTGI